MAESKKQQAKADDESTVEDAAADQPAPEASVKFSRERLLGESLAITGHPRHVVAGALADKGGDDDLTAAQAKSAVDKFLDREVKEA